jgi:hypothetical protein
MLVATSLNPYAKLDYQKLCFDKWKLAGCKIISFNTVTEKQKLLENGFNSKDIEIISNHESGLSLFKKEMPRLMPVITRLLKKENKSYLIVNSDIYLASTKNPESTFKSFSNAFGMTRNEAVDIETHRYSDSNPYRGGLDAFFFDNESLQRILDNFAQDSVAQRMTFGIPGWDYYLGHCILNINSDGIIDSEILLHQSHKTNYSDINEFNHYAVNMIASKKYKSNDVNNIALEFKNLINIIANKNTEKTKLLKLAYYQPPVIKSKSIEGPEETILLDSLQDFLRDVGYSITSRKRLYAYLKSQYSGLNWAGTISYADSELRTENKITKVLGAILILLFFKKHFKQDRYKETYPKGNLHQKALKQILENSQDQKRAVNIIQLFASELLDHNIFNRYLFDYILIGMTSIRGVLICEQILILIKYGIKND